jgi:hypothetical protein
MSFDPLDATLPPALQEVVTYQKPAPEQESKGETIMPEAITANANSALTPEQVRVIASEAVKQADAEKAVAAQLQKLRRRPDYLACTNLASLTPLFTSVP